MTREEIISNLLYMKRSVKEDTIEDMTINEAIKALEQTGWIPLTKRPTTGDDVIFECELPEDNQEVIVSYGDNVRTDIFCIEEGGYHFDCVDILEVEAWMPLPLPYKASPTGEESEDKE